MKITRRFKRLIEDTDSAAGDLLLAMLDEDEVELKELMSAAYAFLEELPEFEEDDYRIQAYLKLNVAMGLDDDYIVDDEVDEEEMDDEDDYDEDDEDEIPW